jgi:hypothetical protein
MRTDVNWGNGGRWGIGSSPMGDIGTDRNPQRKGHRHNPARPASRDIDPDP